MSRYPFNGRNRVTSPYGQRDGGMHKGIDIVGDDNKNVYAVVGGKVIQSRIVNGGKGSGTAEWGNYVSIAGNDGLTYFYCHLDSRAVSTGQMVQEGDLIGVMGNTGRSFGAHLHFEVRNQSNISIDPSAVLGLPNQKGTYTTQTTQTAQPTQTNGDDDMKMGIYVPTDKAVSSQLLKEGAMAIMVDGTLRLLERRMVREIDDTNLSAQFEVMKAEMGNHEMIAVTEN